MVETVTYLLFAAFLVVIGVAAGISNFRRSRFNQALSKAAPVLGLSYLQGNAAIDEAERDMAEEGPQALKVPKMFTRYFGGGVTPCLAGEYKGVHVKVHSETGSPGAGKPAETIWTAYYSRPLHFKLRVTRRDSSEKTQKALSGLEVMTGDEAFDSQVHVDSDDLLEARRFFAEPDRKQAVLSAMSAFPSIVVRRTLVVCKRQIEDPSPEELQSVLDAMVGIVRTF